MLLMIILVRAVVRRQGRTPFRVLAQVMEAKGEMLLKRLVE